MPRVSLQGTQKGKRYNDKKGQNVLLMRILNFDLEEWFHILDSPLTKTEKEWGKYEKRLPQNLDRILKLLDDRNQKATFFCVGWVARNFPDLIRKVDSLGYEIGTHSDMHQLIYEQNRDEFRKDLKTAIKSIEDITGKKVRAYRAPGFSLREETKWVFEILIENGIEIDCSIFPAKRAHGGFESFIATEPSLLKIGDNFIKEFPINVFQIAFKRFVFSGGGYFRVLPYPVINFLMQQSDYVMTYFHPRDFDPEQPMIKGLPLLRKLKSYYGLKTAFKKIEKLLDDFDFTDLETADKKINWRETKVVKL